MTGLFTRVKNRMSPSTTFSQGFTQSHASLVTEEYGSLVSKTDLSTPITPKVLADLKAIQVGLFHLLIRFSCFSLFNFAF